MGPSAWVVLVCAFLSTRTAAAQPLEWAHQFGSAADESAQGVAADATGAYVAGWTTGTFAGQAFLGGYTDSFVCKYDASGAQLWCRQFGTSENETAYAISTVAGGAYSAGYTDGTFDGQTKTGPRDAFVCRHDVDGNLVWCRQFGTDTGYLAAHGVASAPDGVYVVGEMSGAFPGHTPGGYDAFVCKYDASGNQLWCRQLGTPNTEDYEYASGVAADAGGAYVAGSTYGNIDGVGLPGGGDAFICRYDSSGTLAWCRQFGTSSGDSAWGIALDGNLPYVAGTTRGTFSGQTSSGYPDAFVCQYDATGNQNWCRQFGNTIPGGPMGPETNGAAVASDASGVYVAGYTPGALEGQTSTGGFDVFACKYDPAGNPLWCHQFGTTLDEYAFGAATDSSGLYIAGYTWGTFDGQTSVGGADSYLARLQTAPVSPTDLLQALIDSIEGSRYGKAVKTQLTAPLEKALNLLKDGNPGNDASACGHLDAFEDRLEKMLKSRRIGTQDADAWRSASDAIGRALGCLDSEADELSE